MDDMWGDDLPDDIVEECVLLASQATSAAVASPKSKESGSRTVFEFKSPPAVLNHSHHHERKSFVKSAMTLPPVSEPGISSYQATNPLATDIELLKEENKQLTEENLIRSGETSILRADLLQLRKLLEKRDADASKQLDLLKKQIKDMDIQHHKKLEASKTEMKFKELELEEMRNKCKRIEQKGKEQAGTSFVHVSQVQESPQRNKFLNRSVFDSKPTVHQKASLTDVKIQTETIKRFRLNPSRTGLHSFSNVSIIIDTLKHCILSEGSASYEISRLLEELKMRMISSVDDSEEIIRLLHCNDTGLIELICSIIERDKNTAQFVSYIEFLSSWAVHVLPTLSKDKCDRLLNSILNEVRRLSFREMLTISAAVITNFGLDPICARVSGCLLEKAALQLKDTFTSYENEVKLDAAFSLVLTLSTMLSCSTENETKTEKCSCIPHLLRTLVFIIQHVTDSDVAFPASELRSKLLIQVFRLSLSILKARREPWLTFINSPSDVNRLFTILTAISEATIPETLSHQIDVSSFTGPGLGLCG